MKGRSSVVVRSQVAKSVHGSIVSWDKGEWARRQSQEAIEAGDVDDSGLPAPRQVVQTTALDCQRLCKKFHLDMFEVRDLLAEFLKMDVDGFGTLTGEQFAASIRDQLCLKEDAELPRTAESHVKGITGPDCTGVATFEDYVSWTSTLAFSPQAKGYVRTDNDLRKYARTMNLDLSYVEKVLGEFRRWDKDHSGQMEKTEFVTCLRHVMQSQDEFDIPAERIDRFWKEVDQDGSGAISPEEFIMWYMKYFPVASGDSQSIPASMVYKRLSVNRFQA